MRFHLPSFALGFVTAVAARSTAKRLRPVIVELGSLGLHIAHSARAVVERELEEVEDLWADIQERVRARARGIGGGEREEAEPERTSYPERASAPSIIH